MAKTFFETLNLDMKLSAHFSLREFIAAGDIWAKQFFTKTHLINLMELAQELEGIRTYFNQGKWKLPKGERSVTISSGYRSDKYNAMIGGARFSQHKNARAADYTVSGVPYSAVLAYIKSSRPKIGGAAIGNGFIHSDTRQRVNGVLVTWTY